MPKTTRRTAPRRSKKPRPEPVLHEEVTWNLEEPHVLTEEEKRELILAHVAARAEEPRQWGIGYAIGLVASCLVVAVGWLMTFSSNMRASLTPEPEPLLEATREPLQKFQEELPSLPDFGRPIEELKRQFEEERRRAASSTQTP
jgi:hypothetical protein